MIIEDDEDARSNLEDILSLDGYRIYSESHCLPAIVAIESTPLDAVIVDWNLPDGDGGELISIISKAQPNTPVIVVTGVRDFETSVEALRCGAYDFLCKPFNPDVLRAALRRLVERKQHLLEIERAHQKLVNTERLAAIGQMVAGLAHESRNAFQRCYACLAELSLDLEDMPESMKLVQKVQKAMDDINRLLEEVREYSAPIILERRDCNLAELVEETWKEISELRPVEHPPLFRIDVTGNFPATCFVDGERIGQVIRNLLENARFACADPGQIRVALGVKSVDPVTICIEVTDDGDGLPEDVLEQIFTPFFTTKTQGTGLGLAICRRIVAAHRGRLYGENSEAGGARFVVEIPLKDS